MSSIPSAPAIFSSTNHDQDVIPDAVIVVGIDAWNSELTDDSGRIMRLCIEDDVNSGLPKAQPGIRRAQKNCMRHDKSAVITTLQRLMGLNSPSV